jgi:ankyrin repeat protein
MAYLAPDNIPIEGFFSKLAFDEQIIDEKMPWSAVELLYQYSMINIVKGVSNIHRLVQQVMRIELQNQSKEEEILEKALKLINSADIATNSANHIASVWNYASKYGKVIDEFYFNSFYEWNDKTPLCILAKNGHSKAIEAILIHIGKNKLNEMRKLIYTPIEFFETPFKTAISNGYLDVIKVFLEKGADANAADIRGDTPLHWAAANGKLGVVKYLVEEKDADANAANEDGNTPLHRAAANGKLDVVKYLVEEKGADANAANNNGDTPLHWAAEDGEWDVVKYLVEEKGADAKAANNPGDTPLHRAAANGEWDVVKYLVEEKGADAKAANKAGDTPLHRAAANGEWDVVKYLVEKGADAEAADKDGNTPLHWAAANGHWHVEEYLKEKAAHNSSLTRFLASFFLK